MAKALYGTLFDWIVLQVNHALAIKQLNVVEVGLYTFSFICEVILCFSHNSVPTDCKLLIAFYKPDTPPSPFICPDKWLTLETSPIKTLYDGQFSLTNNLQCR